MKFLTSLLLSGSVALAQQVIQIQVGGEATSPGGVFQFSPNNVTASVGDIITFNFSGTPGNHSVTQSTFASPCNPASGGFDSGWVGIPTNLSASDAPVWNLTITNTSAIWFYCKQLNPTPGHCPKGMVGAINPPTTGNNTFANYLKNAAAFNSTPGQGGPQGALVGLGGSASAAPGPLPSGATLFGAPTVTASGANSTNTSPTSSGSGPGSSNTSAASPLSRSSGLVGLLAALLGVTLV